MDQNRNVKLDKKINRPPLNMVCLQSEKPLGWLKLINAFHEKLIYYPAL